MRFKFRAFYKGDIQRDIYLLFEQRDIESELFFVCAQDSDLRYSFDTPFWDDDWIVEQFTGLLDRNGKEVYDGDIAVWFYGNTSHLGKIIWAEQVGKFMFKDFEDNNAYDFKTIQVDKELEVIGNAHETDIDSIILRFMSNCYLQKEGII